MRIVDKGTKYWWVVEPQTNLGEVDLVIAKFVRLADAQEYIKLIQPRLDKARQGKDVIHG